MDSCIFVHGLGGHALDSFSSVTGTYVWPRDLLPNQYPQLRVWTYGYTPSSLDADSIKDYFEDAETFRRHLRLLRRNVKVKFAKSGLSELDGNNES